MDLRGFQGIFLVVVEETLGKLDLIHTAYGEFIIAEDGTAHLKAFNGFLSDDLGIILESEADGCIQFLRGDDLCYAKGRTGADWLDKDRKA